MSLARAQRRMPEAIQTRPSLKLRLRHGHKNSCDAGHSKDAKPQMIEVIQNRLKVMNPPAAKSIQEIDTKLTEWKADIRYLREAGLHCSQRAQYSSKD